MTHPHQPRILPFAPASEYFFDEGCYIIELMNDEADPALSIARARVAPGVTTQWHRLMDTAERYVIQQGEGLVEVGDLPAQTVGPGDVVIIPPDCPQRIGNTGSGDLIFLALCTPRFKAENYQVAEKLPALRLPR